MLIKFSKPLSFSEVGQRSKNEDSIFPLLNEANENTTLFLVCDGIGGADKGEVASKLVCEGISEYFFNSSQLVFNEEELTNALTAVYGLLDSYMTDNQFVSRMGSTLALLQKTNEGIVVAHLGDSRIMQIRNNKILFQTHDHKQVLEMVKEGIITEQQAKNHPWRNRLSKAIVASHAGNSKDKPEIKLITDIQKDDYFLMCTDGFLEQIDEEVITSIFQNDCDNTMKLEKLLDICKDNTKDNYSGYLIHIDNILC